MNGKMVEAVVKGRQSLGLEPFTFPSLGFADEDAGSIYFLQMPNGYHASVYRWSSHEEGYNVFILGDVVTQVNTLFEVKMILQEYYNKPKVTFESNFEPEERND